MNEPVTLFEVLKLARQLPLAEKVRLIEKMAPHIQREISQEGGRECSSHAGHCGGCGVGSI
jgi:hypothetical protein